MGKGKRYTQEYKDMIVDLYKSGMTLVELSKEYNIARSTLNGWIDKKKEIKVSDDEIMTKQEIMDMKKEMTKIKEENEILKKLWPYCNQKVHIVVSIIETHKKEFGIARMCEVLGIARSSYYKALTKSETPRAKEKEELKDVIHRIYDESKGRYGSPKIHKILTEKEGYKISEKRVQKLMREMNLYSITVKKYKHYSNKKVVEGLENVLKRDFSTKTINEKWVGDITYIHTLKDGWTYLASVLDLYSKKIIGYAYGKSMDNSLVLKALTNAYESQKPSEGVIFHTDLGSQYTSNDMRKECSKLKIRQSFSKKGCPYDNACIESFHAALKKEEVYTTKYSDYNSAKIAIFKYIEGWYNTRRIHSSINYMTPNECERLARSKTV